GFGSGSGGVYGAGADVPEEGGVGSSAPRGMVFNAETQRTQRKRREDKESPEVAPKLPVAVFALHLLCGGKRSTGFRLAGSDLAYPVHDLTAPLQLLRCGHRIRSVI